MILQEIARPENTPFTVALTMMFALGILQVASLFLGLGTFSFIDDWLPELDADGQPGLETNISASDSIFTAFLSWLNLGKVPFLVSLITFLFLYSFIGFNGQILLVQTLGIHLPAWIAGILAIFPAVPLLRWANAGIGKIMPKDESAAVSTKTFIGRVAIITIGTARYDRPAEAKVKGPLGKVHYIMVVPDDNEKEFSQGEKVLLVSQAENGNFNAIEIKNQNLIK